MITILEIFLTQLLKTDLFLQLGQLLQARKFFGLCACSHGV